MSVLKEEFVYHYGNKRLVLLRSLLCYFRVLNFRVVVLICYMQKTRRLHEKKRIKKKLKLKYGVDIGLNTKIGLHPWVEHYYGLVLGDGVVIGDQCTLYQGVTLGQRKNKYPVVGNNVIVYPNSIILGDIQIGDNAIILAGSVVLKDVLPYSIVGGNPAVVKKMIISNV
ncbi:MAG: serine acetyltransferase [Oscillospiraceae bacterium]|nr:serine acetyltransferase [Oscillospiraceae bacterium]